MAKLVVFTHKIKFTHKYFRIFVSQLTVRYEGSYMITNSKTYWWFGRSEVSHKANARLGRAYREARCSQTRNENGRRRSAEQHRRSCRTGKISFLTEPASLTFRGGWQGFFVPVAEPCGKSFPDRIPVCGPQTVCLLPTNSVSNRRRYAVCRKYVPAAPVIFPMKIPPILLVSRWKNTIFVSE